ncbi:ATP-binding cassette domain-containing protein [Haliea sp. AH-315-K21]|uniref:Probable ATP-binding protein YheS n=1 Tax=SAR86 cluster bacterium TaxID=2030880 RepID=A0A2A5CA33_9GAMM|nr:ATP-binding cassette domain-containing protein [Haliea sp. AH-315-K21]MBN4075408.1 ATP-binding cassette domain-containing protein [Gammaproteobacteria bacterium AH-315-E17]PCJ40226.1 MAG: ABC transporter ATP-binding protein [SAR86 cluster bacterium]
MISLQDISLRLGSQLLLDEVALTVYAGQKAGIIGRNGTGKTSLFKLLMGELSPDTGELDFPKDLRKSQMRQETKGSQSSAIEYVIDGDIKFRDIEKQLAQAEQANDDHKLALLHAELDLHGGWTIQNRAEQLLSGLGFPPEDFTRTVDEFSGGWRIRLNLAQALMTPSDLLLLDEPTNHLDLEATLWLQQWLLRYQGTLLLVSHDRSFLDVVVGHIISFENKKLILYRGNYSAFEKQKAERMAQQQAQYEKQQTRKKEIEDFVRRFRAKASKARQAQSRIKELSRMVDIAPAHIDSPFHFKFLEPAKLPPSLLACDKIAIGYETPLIQGFSINIRSDSRIGLLGSNGQGKSTLLKVLAGKLPLLGGEINRSDHIKIGYCAQHQVDELDISATPMKLIQSLNGQVREQEIRNFLGGFDFQGDRVTETIEHFSGGEKSRLALALVVWQKPNLLLMDEPTNHLDLEMCHSLTVGLQAFSGALILVSHDRHLLGNTVDQFLLVKDGKLDIFEGDLNDYEKLLLESNKSDNKPRQAKAGKLNKKELRQQAAEKRNHLKSLRTNTAKLEKDIQLNQNRLSAIEEKLADSALYEDGQKDKLNKLLQERAQLISATSELEEEWLNNTEKMEHSEQ